MSMVPPRIAIVLAAGKGTRLKSTLPKVLHSVLGKPMLQRVLEAFKPLGLDKAILVVGHEADAVIEAVKGFDLGFPVEFVTQEPQLGTGHAVMQVLPLLPPETEADVLITCGDMPLVPPQRYEYLLELHRQKQPVASLVTVSVGNPTGYGRVITAEQNRFVRIVEEKDANLIEKQVSLINAGIYAVFWPVFSAYFEKLTTNNAQGEFYLTDTFGHIVSEQGPDSILTVTWPNEDEVLGINSREQLSQASDILSQWTAKRLLSEGVSLVNPRSMTLAPEIRVAPDTTLLPGCTVLGEVTIGSGCQIGPHTTLRGDINIGDNTTILHSVLDKAVTVGSNSWVGPFAHLRDNAVIGDTVKIGNFVEAKEMTMGDRANAAHLSYLGDVSIGNDVNMGAGTIIANYDPIRDLKHRSVIAEGAKVGCNSVLVSPVNIGENACVAAGSVITKDVSPWDLAIARCKQSTLVGWVKSIKAALHV